MKIQVNSDPIDESIQCGWGILALLYFGGNIIISCKLNWQYCSLQVIFFVGSHRDSDEHLEPLCEDWLRIKGQLTSKKASCLLWYFPYTLISKWSGTCTTVPSWYFSDNRKSPSKFCTFFFLQMGSTTLIFSCICFDLSNAFTSSARG